MVWINSIVIGILSAALAAVCSGFVAARGVDWYRVTSREGASGYLIVSVGLLGLIAGLIIGCTCGGVVHADSFASFLRATGWAFGIILVLLGIGLAVTWMRADVPPKLDGEELFLIAEFRLPAAQTAAPREADGDAHMLLGSLPVGSHTIRQTRRGPLFLDEARLEDGRRIVRGATELFTQRGRRFLLFALSESCREGFRVPLPARPGKRFAQWSQWLPDRAAVAGDAAQRLQYRFRVQRRSEPMRIEHVGPFEIATITGAFFDEAVGDKTCVSSSDTFRVRHRGQPVFVGETILSVATFPSASPALVVCASHLDEQNAFYLLREINGSLSTDLISHDNGDRTLRPISPAAEPQVRVAPYRSPQRRELSEGGYEVGISGVFDTRSLAIGRREIQ